MTDVTLQRLVSLVREHYAISAEPLLLARLGQLLADDRRELAERYGSLAAAVKAAAPDLELLARADQAGRVAVVTPDMRTKIYDRLASQLASAEAAFSQLPLPLQIAFCLKTEPSEVVAVKIGRPVRYERLSSGLQSSPGFIVIEDRFRQPGLKLQEATSTELEKLWRSFLQWAEQARVDVQTLQRQTPPANALERLMAAQEPDIVGRMVLPGDIVTLLLRHP